MSSQTMSRAFAVKYGDKGKLKSGEWSQREFDDYRDMMLSHKIFENDDVAKRKAELDLEKRYRRGVEKRAESTGSRIGFGFRTMFGGESAPVTRGTLFGN